MQDSRRGGGGRGADVIVFLLENASCYDGRKVGDEKMMDIPTYGQTNGWTVGTSYGDAWTYLKPFNLYIERLQFFVSFFL